MIRKGLPRALVPGILGLLLAGCPGRRPPNDDIPTPPPAANFPDLPQAPPLKVLVMGDWGTGGNGQQAVADAMAATHADSPPDLVLTVGDNFYPRGVKGPGDPLWESTFESVYKGPFWDGLNFYPALGNHDHLGRPEAQMEYSSVSPRWIMPGAYHSFTRDLPAGSSVRFVALDTQPFAQGAANSEIQRLWADSVLASDFPGWTIAYGHHPLTSGGWHRPDASVTASLLALLRHRVPLYLAGHNHTTELLDTGAGFLQGICGGGGGRDNPYRVEAIPGTLAAFTNGGWCFLRIWPGTLAVDLYDREGGLQHRQLLRR